MLVSAFVVLTFEHALPVWLLIVAGIRDIVLVLGYLMILIRRRRALSGPSEHLRESDHSAAYRMRDWHAHREFRTQPA